MPTHCLNCGYEAALDSGPCPECGTPLTPRFFETESGQRWLAALRSADRAGNVGRVSTLLTIVIALTVPLVFFILSRAVVVSGLANAISMALPIGFMTSAVVAFIALHWCLFRLSVPLTIDNPSRSLLASFARWTCVAGAIMMAGVTTVNYAGASLSNIQLAVLDGAAALACAAEVVLAAYLIVARGYLVQPEGAVSPLWKRSPLRAAWSNTIVGIAIAVAMVGFRTTAPGAFTIFWLGWLLTAWTLSRAAEAMRKRAEVIAKAESAVYATQSGDPSTPSSLTPE